MKLKKTSTSKGNSSTQAIPNKVKVKKISGKRKQKGRGLISKIKREVEKRPEDEFSELEKEALIIRINELESKVNRKKDLCSSLKEENKLYKYFYDKEIKAKRNSTKLLNCAYEELATEILLLKIELVAMEHNYNKLLEDKEFCLEAKEKVRRLTNLKEILDAKLSEAEKCPSQNIDLRLKLDELHTDYELNSKKYEEEKTLMLAEFKTLIQGVQDDMKDTMEKLMNDKDLKLNLLHVPYQGLFLCGINETSYLDLALNRIENFLEENIKLHKDLIQMDLNSMTVQQNLKKLASKISVSEEVLEYLPSRSYNKIMHSEMQRKESEIFINEIGNHISHIEDFKAKIKFEERRIRKLEARLKEREKDIKIKEVQEKETVNIDLTTIIIMAGDIIRKEVQVIPSL